MDYLQTLPAIRVKSQKVYEATKEKKGVFELNEDNLNMVVNKVIELIKRDYPSPNDVPMHSRWRHFNVVDSHSESLGWKTKNS